LEKVPVSVTIITKNEEENIRSCLQAFLLPAGLLLLIPEVPMQH